MSKKKNPYKKISSKEIKKAGEHDGLKALLMCAANATLKDAKNKAKTKEHTPKFHDSGWTITLETPKGLVGLWSCWLRDRFHLVYPLNVKISDSLIKETLGVEDAKPVTQVSATSVSNSTYNLSEWKDDDKPLLPAADGNGGIAYKTSPKLRLWDKFYGPQLEEGRVWISHEDHNSYSVHLHNIKNKSLVDTYFGHDHSMSISTFPFTFCNEYALDSPTTQPEAIQPYREKFFDLLCKIADKMGCCSAVHIDYGFVFVPEQLTNLGYSVEWLKGNEGEREGWGNELVYATKGDEELMLESANSMVPWVCVRRINVEKCAKEKLVELLTF